MACGHFLFFFSSSVFTTFTLVVFCRTCVAVTNTQSRCWHVYLQTNSSYFPFSVLLSHHDTSPVGSRVFGVCVWGGGSEQFSMKLQPRSVNAAAAGFCGETVSGNDTRTSCQTRWRCHVDSQTSLRVDRRRLLL